LKPNTEWRFEAGFGETHDAKSNVEVKVKNMRNIAKKPPDDDLYSCFPGLPKFLVRSSP
jgi:hypothetical protein